MNIYYDMKTGEVSHEGPTGVKGFISYHRLVQTLKREGEIREGEEVVGITANEVGLVLHFSKWIP